MSLPYLTIRNIAQELIAQLMPITPEGIREKADIALKIGGSDPGIDFEALVRDLESRFNLWIGRGSVLDDKDDQHVAWLPLKRADTSWDFWNRYREYLLTRKGFEPALIDSVEELTDQILERLEDPSRSGEWNRRGLVVGQVQSGKTANYTGLICKALDAGYKLVVVLTGMHDNLRSQTQLRIDEGVLGRDTRRTLAADPANPHRIGVGLQPYPKHLIVQTLTSSADDGDFKRKMADQAGFTLGGDPLVLVVKKNVSVLRNVNVWASAVSGRRDSEGAMMVGDVPMLLIDDEADIASPNTKKVPVVAETGLPPDDYDVSAINKAIRSLLQLFKQTAYVGYTATPFANIFIHPDRETAQLGQDLFPRSFIISLPTPPHYVGPVKVFGHNADPDAGLPGAEGLPIIRRVDDQESWLPDGHKKDDIPSALPRSLVAAMYSFLLACAARNARGDSNAHASMLVHVTRYTRVQEEVTSLVRDELEALRNRLAFGDEGGPAPIREVLKKVWDDDFVKTTAALGSDAGRHVGWHEVDAHLLPEARRIEIKTINGYASDVLDYAERQAEGVRVIAVGGDKLSRGLTLEGLTTSYYLRASKMYDTLMQMGRWFGYRRGYLDLCRLYTTPELVDWYRHITLANEELRQDFEMMAAAGQTPMEYGLRVRAHPNGLLITAANKLRNGTTVRLSYAGDLSETIVFDKAPEYLRANVRATELLIEDLGGAAAARPTRDNKLKHSWAGVSGARIADFLATFKTHDKSRKARSKLLEQYVRAQLENGELTSWTVVLISKGSTDRRVPIAGISVGLTRRAPFPQPPEGLPPADRFAIRQLHSPADEAVDLSVDEWAQAVRLTQVAAHEKNGESEILNTPSGPAVRKARDKHRGLLLIYPLDYEVRDRPELSAPPDLPPIGLVLSFPNSDTAKTIDYTVNNVYWDQEFAT